MKQIPLTNSIKTALVDESDYDKCARKQWYLRVNKKNKHLEYVMCQEADYRKSGGKKFQTYLHTFILGKPPEDMVIDHINGNVLDNRKDNLRFLSRSDNMIRGKI